MVLIEYVQVSTKEKAVEMSSSLVKVVALGKVAKHERHSSG